MAVFSFVKLGKKIFGKQKGTGEAIKRVPVGKNLKTKRFQQDDIIKTREKVMTEYGIKDPKSRVALRTKANQPKINKKIADIADRQDKARVKKMGGGMMGRRFGMRAGTPKPKTNVEKIKETFSPKGKKLKKIPEGKKGEGLRKLKAARPDVTRKMGFLKRGGRA